MQLHFVPAALHSPKHGACAHFIGSQNARLAILLFKILAAFLFNLSSFRLSLTLKELGETYARKAQG